MPGERVTEAAWPALPLEAWRDTCATLHMWTQMVGKTRLALAPPQNHWWHVALYVTARGLTTSPMPYSRFTFQVDFDFIDHRLTVVTSEGARQDLALAPRPVAEFYRQYLATLGSLGISVKLWPMPVEVEHPIRFTEDNQHAAYDPEYAHRFWRILTRVDQVLRQFRGRFLGKSSPVHFFWGSFDLAASRFSGRRAPERPGADRVTREGYSHELTSAGFWPGSGTVQETAFYAYAAPEPAGFRDAPIQPAGVYYHPPMSLFILPYDAVRAAPSPEAALLAFLESTYSAAADLGGWDRAALERH
ncbi:MAG TPA: DUF5996 family protein [Gemmatimonadales bacterium]|nr:DUF5996 family protein [Gemmatimonadales bacterium]